MTAVTVHAPQPAAPVTHTVLDDTPVGPLTLVATGESLSGLYMTDQRHRPPQETLGDPADPDEPRSPRPSPSSGPTSAAS